MFPTNMYFWECCRDCLCLLSRSTLCLPSKTFLRPTATQHSKASMCLETHRSFVFIITNFVMSQVVTQQIWETDACVDSPIGLPHHKLDAIRGIEFSAISMTFASINFPSHCQDSAQGLPFVVSSFFDTLAFGSYP